MNLNLDELDKRYANRWGADETRKQCVVLMLESYPAIRAEIDRLTAEAGAAHQVERSLSEQVRHLDEACAKLETELALAKTPTQWTYQGDFGDNDVVDSPDDMADGLEVGVEFDLTPWRQVGPPVKFTSETDANGCAYAKIVEVK